MNVCFFHPDRPAYIQCQRCDRPVCPECQITAPVGFHCPSCVQQAAARRPIQRTQFGAAVRADEKPKVTYTVIAICAVMYLLQLATWQHGGAAQRLTGVDLPDVTRLMWFAPMDASAHAVATGTFEPWRMLTSAILHHPQAGVHILFNMLALWFVGRVIEPTIGRARFAALLGLSAFGGSVAVLFLTHPAVPTLGASGAVFGLFGALFILMRATGGETGGIVALIAVNMVVSFIFDGISWQGHLGGLLTGALVAFVIVRAPRRGRTLWHTLGLAGVGVVLLILATIGAFTVPSA